MWTILDELLMPHTTSYCPRIDGLTKGEASPVLCLSNAWKVQHRECFWFSETPDRPSIGWDSVHPRVCAMMKLRHVDRLHPDLWVLSLHLDHHGKVARAQSLDLLSERVDRLAKTGAAVVVCGDFNMSSVRDPMRRFLADSPHLKDAAYLHPVGLLKPTFLGWGWFHFARARIDHILHSHHCSSDAYQAHRALDANSKLLSDHRAVVVDFSFSG